MVVSLGSIIEVRGGHLQGYLIRPDRLLDFQPADVVGFWIRAHGPIPIGARCTWTRGSGPSLRREFATILSYWVEKSLKSH